MLAKDPTSLQSPNSLPPSLNVEEDQFSVSGLQKKSFNNFIINIQDDQLNMAVFFWSCLTGHPVNKLENRVCGLLDEAPDFGSWGCRFVLIRSPLMQCHHSIITFVQNTFSVSSEYDKNYKSEVVW